MGQPRMIDGPRTIQARALDPQVGDVWRRSWLREDDSAFGAEERRIVAVRRASTVGASRLDWQWTEFGADQHRQYMPGTTAKAGSGRTCSLGAWRGWIRGITGHWRRDRRGVGLTLVIDGSLAPPTRRELFDLAYRLAVADLDDLAEEVVTIAIRGWDDHDDNDDRVRALMALGEDTLR